MFFLIFWPVFPYLHYIIYYTSQFFSCWWTCFFTALKSLVISLMRSSSSHSSGSESSIFVKFTFLEFYLDTIYSCKSEPPYNDRSPSTGEWLSSVIKPPLYLYWNLLHVFFLPFVMSVAFSWQSWLLLPSSFTLTLTLEVILGLTLILSALWLLFGLMLIVATPVQSLALLYAVRLLLKVSNVFPILSLILFTF